MPLMLKILECRGKKCLLFYVMSFLQAQMSYTLLTAFANSSENTNHGLMLFPLASPTFLQVSFPSRIFSLYA